MIDFYEKGKLSFQEKNILITGGSSGIGKKVLKDLNKLNAKTITIGRSNTQASYHYKCDLNNTKNLIITLNDLEFTKIDGFVHCAGVNKCAKINNISLDDWEYAFNVNLKSAFIIVKTLFEKFKKSKSCSIVFVSSIASHRKSLVSGVHYSSSKAGLDGLMRQLSFEFGNHGIRVNTVNPSQTWTNMLKKSMRLKEIMNLKKQIPLGRIANLHEQSLPIIFLLSNLSSYIHGTSLKVDGGQI